MRSNPAFIVEGHMEQKIVSKICPGQPVRRVECNGDNVPIERVCDFIASHIRLFGNRNYPIIVILDREKREESVRELSAAALEYFGRNGLGDQDIRIFFADSEFEDWYLKDLDSICEYFGIPRPNGNFHGKGGLSQVIQGAVRYHETTVGFDLFFIVSLKTIANSCDVFSALLEVARELQCDQIADRVDVLM